MNVLQEPGPAWVPASLLALALVSGSTLRPGPGEEEALIATETVELNSEVLGETRSLRVWVPPGYQQSTKRYPVLYLLDLDGRHTAFAAGTVGLLAQLGMAPEMMVIGLGDIDGRRDLTPTRTPAYGPTSGGADAFLEHLLDEVLPYVEEHYRADELRLFWGHSIVGALGTYALLSQPDLFQGLVLSSPWLIYDQDERFLLENAPEFLAQWDGSESFLYFTVGDESNLEPSVEELAALLGREAPPELEWKFEHLAGENHTTVLPKTLVDGLTSMFRDWKGCPVEVGR